MEMANVEDLWLPISGTYVKDGIELIVWLESVTQAGQLIPRLALR